MADINRKRAETTIVEALLLDGNGEALDLTGPPTIKFQARGKFDEALKIDAPAAIIDAPTARVRATLSATDTDTTGNYICEWRVTYAPGQSVIVPEEDYVSLRIWEDLAPDA